MGESAASGTSIVTLSTNQSLSGDRGRPSTVVNGIPIYAPSIAPVYWAPSLSARLSFSGPQQPSVLASLTASPRAVVLAQARTATTPSAWRWIASEGIRFAVPATWALARSTHAPPCGTDIVLPVAGVTLAREPALPLPCPLPEAEVRAVPQVGGVEVDGFKPSSLESTTCVGPRTIGSLHVCISPTPGYGVLVVQLSALGMTPMTVKIGMTGNGTVARSILHSLRRSST